MGERTPEPDQPRRRRGVSRRRFLGAGAAATAGGVALAGAAAAIGLRGGGAAPDVGASPPPAASPAPATAAAGGPAAIGGAAVQVAPGAGVAPADRRTRVQHLLRRAGFAPNHDEVDRALQLGDAELVDALINADTAPENLSTQLTTFAPADGAQRKPVELVAWWLGCMTATARPALEKTTFFWHGFHTSGFDKLGARGTPQLYAQNVFQREHAFGRFADILKGISRQPAMMIYLDTIQNLKAHANENFGRELMELFSLGVGNYTEVDVREVSRAFTGYSLDRAREFVLRPRQHDDGTKTVLGHTGDFSGDDVIDIIVAQPAAATFVAGKVWSAFAYPNPDAATIEPVARTFADTGGDMREVFRAVFSHPEFGGARAYRALVKGPVEFAVGAVRQLGATVDPRLIAAQLNAMGQVPFNPPNVAGWPGGESWMGSGAFLAGINGVDGVLFGTRGAAGGFDAARYLDDRRIATAGQLVDDLLLLLVDGAVSPAQRATLIDYASAGGDEDTSLSSLRAADRDSRVRGTAYLLMAGPEYHLA